jgi:hypothetical protein
MLGQPPRPDGLSCQSPCSARASLRAQMARTARSQQFDMPNSMLSHSRSPNICSGEFSGFPGSERADRPDRCISDQVHGSSSIACKTQVAGQSALRRCGAAALDVLAALADEYCPDRPPVRGERRPEGSLLAAGMIVGADSIDDLDLLRDGAMAALFGGIRAPSTLGSFLRSFTWGNVLQLEKVSRAPLADLARRAPLLPGRTPWRSLTWTPCKSASTDARSKARRSAKPRSSGKPAGARAALPRETRLFESRGAPPRGLRIRNECDQVESSMAPCPGDLPPSM